MKAISFAAAALLVSACAGYGGAGLKPGIATEGEVRATMGPPAMELRDSDGTRHLYYPRGPLGNQTYVADLGSDGLLREVRQVLGDDTFNRIQQGMTGEEVLRRIGPPREKMHFANLRQTAWDYKFRDTWGYEAIFSVMVDDNGIVAGKITRRIEARERGR